MARCLRWDAIHQAPPELGVHTSYLGSTIHFEDGKLLDELLASGSYPRVRFAPFTSCFEKPLDTLARAVMLQSIQHACSSLIDDRRITNTAFCSAKPAPC